MENKNKKDVKGPISVTDDITPITHQPVNQITANEWSALSLTELWEQRVTLDNRLNYALQLGHSELIKQLQRGLSQLDEIIKQRSSTSDDSGLI